ncbi:exonuclease family protein [Babesia divergens]|uniref:Exonuclease family protein n=1 Tax=Babesia divergens TaxID=32595 RepID=A0AAD9LEN3_BABDI|nr:exonuclease family protein [Babesia divergens]
MQCGIVKYDRWEDLIWVYNSIDSYIRTPLTGALAGIDASNQDVKYVNWMTPMFNGYHQPDEHDFNAYCRCYMHGINAIQPYEMGLIIATARGIDILNRDGGRRMKVMSERAERHIASEGNNHIACSLLSCNPTNSKILVSTNSDRLYALDAFSGQLSGEMKVENHHIPVTEFDDQITVVADLNGNRSRSSCVMSYYHTYAGNTDLGNDEYQSFEYSKTDSFNSKKGLSLESIAQEYGSIEAIPEFVPAAKKATMPSGTMNKLKMPYQKTAGGISLGYAMLEQEKEDVEYACSRDTTCVGMLSGLLHIVDHRMQKIAYTVQAHTNAVANISAYGNHIATTGCYLYGSTLIYEPMIEIHDIRMERSRSIWLGAPVCSTAIVKRTNKIVALKAGGEFCECDLKTLEQVQYPNLRNQNTWNYHDVDIKINPARGSYTMFTADEAYAVNNLELENKEHMALEVNPESLKPIFQKIQPDKMKYEDRTMFAPMVGSFPGDLAQVFVQVFFFLSKLESLMYHCCEVEHCLACQVGFALHMLHVAHENRKGGFMKEDSGGRVVRRREMQVTQLQELMPVYRSETSTSAVQRLLIWIIEKINSELENYYSQVENGYQNVDFQLIKSVFGFSKKVESTCLNGHQTHKIVENELFMDYKHLQSGKSYEDEMASYCVECSKPIMTKYKTEVHRSPNFMIIRCEHEGDDISEVQECINFNDDPYTIVTIIFSVPSADTSNRLLAYVRVPQEMKGNEEWLLINDGYVCELSSEDIGEMFDFTPRWKQPIILIYRKDNIGAIKPIVPILTGDFTVVNVHGRIVPLPTPDRNMPIPASIFTSEYNIAHNPKAHDKTRTFVPLSLEELLAIHREQFIVALDVECVKAGNETSGPSRHLNVLDQSVSECSVDNMGHRKTFIYTHKYSDEHQLSTLARVSAVRGSGDAIGIPFLDHYIYRRKPPKDYLTRFSGIHQGDLDLKSSVHWLTTRKAIYMKIRYLIDAGCKILGHGLEQDFKMLNIVVPQDQIIDTVELYRLPGKRYISLQFLAAQVLNQRIQQDEHDSIEDAKTALDLYRKYLEYKANGRLEDVLKSLYDIGYKTSWVVS